MKIESKHTPEHIHNPSYPCSCEVVFNGKSYGIKYCPKHSAAPELLEALKTANEFLECRLGMSGPDKWVLQNNIRAAIAKAEGR